MLKTSMGLKKIFDITLLKEETELLTNAGFDTADLDFSMTDEVNMLYRDDLNDYLCSAKAYLDSMHFPIYQGHAPFGMKKGKPEEETEKLLREIRMSIPAAKQLGIAYLIVHPVFYDVRPDNPQNLRDKTVRENIAMYKELCELGDKNGVKICTENMWSRNENQKIVSGLWSETNDFLELFDAVPELCFCFDIGHAALLHLDPGAFVTALAPRVTTLHLHSNDGRSDLHISPFEQTPPDFDSLCAALKKTGYSGSVNLEVGNFLPRMPKELLPSGYRFLHDCAAYIARRIG